ncbi:hypothetical protein F610DRAFT_00746 [Streptomyces sp. LaPpAH-199]|uniref:hypothetical protein n=1 Tax=Streptomyces TaxID=1883 RepID=UPI0008864139|nr:hypothetical protein [Streptomyces sp. LaPpAH-199]SDB96220.1 hypothetical protein F610DRAFT_00746 [Streptomyces sp. LaPpAH-199]
MARLTHTVTVAPLDRGWFEEAAGTLVDLLDGSRARADGSVLLADGRAVAGLRLLKGRHLRAGARYGETPEPVKPGADGRVPARPGTAGATDGPSRSGTAGAGAAGGTSSPGASGGVPAPGPSATVGAVVLRAWRPAHSVEVESRVAEDGLALRLKVRLSEPRRPRALGLSLSGHRPAGGSLYRFSGRGTADLAAWWAAVDRLPSALPAARPPVTARAAHRLAKARLTVTPHPADDGSWRISVVLSVRGRWLLRPVGAVALFFARRPVERGFREAVENAAAQWNTALAELTPRHGEALRAEIADALTETEPGKTVPGGPTDAGGPTDPWGPADIGGPEAR